MIEIRDRVFEGRGIIIREDALFENCVFRNITMDNGWCGDGIQCSGPIKVTIRNCEFNNEGVDPANSDEAVSGFRDGCQIFMENCTIRNWGKGILMGNGDYTKEEEGDLFLHCKNCTFDRVGRRAPFIRYGTALMERCTFFDWGEKGTYDVKGNCIKANDAKVILRDCTFIQSNFHFEWKDFINQFAPDDVYGLENPSTGKLLWAILRHPWKFIRAWKPGCMKGVELNQGSKVTYSNCKKNRWWICLQK